MKRRMLAHKKTIALLYHYLPLKKTKEYFSSEHLVVDNQTDSIVRYMKKLFMKRGFFVQVIKIEENDLSNLKKLKADFVFNLVDSKAMEIKIAKVLSRLKIPHSGSSFDAIRTSNNKLKSKHIFQKSGLPTPPHTVLHLKDRLKRSLIPSKFPIIIKPAFEHCSIGITQKSIATTYEQFKKIVSTMRKQYKQTLLVEEYIPGKELQVTVLETKDKTVALPIAEIGFKKHASNKWNIYGFDEKWRKNMPSYKQCYFVAPPKRIHPDSDTQIKKDSIRAFYALGLRDYARFDLRFNPKKNQWYFLESNANAGFDPSPRDAMTTSIKAYGITFDDFVLQIVKNSLHS